MTAPNGEPPVGGLKMPLTRRSSVLPVGVSSWNGEPIDEVVLLRVLVVHERPVRAELREDGLRALFQSTCEDLTAWPGRPPVTWTRLAEGAPLAGAHARDRRPRPGAVAAAFAALVGIGEKLFCAVIA